MITVYTVIPGRHSASFYYRLQVPLETARDLGLPVRAIIDPNQADMPAHVRFSHFAEADVILLYQPVGEHVIQNFRSVQSFIPSKRDGEWKWPPTIVVETDDNLFNVSPLNQAFRNLGTRDMNGKEIPLNHHVGVVREGERQILYADGHNGFSLAANRQRLASYRKILQMADAVQCSTPPVEEAVRRELIPARTRVFPNLVRFDHYEQVDLAEDSRLKILWQGGSAHYEDWYPLREALGRITEKYPHVHWMIWGAQYPWVKEKIPPHRYTFMNWCPYQEYRLRLAMVGHDISIAPLQQNVFNRCRSAIKWYEACVLKKDVATVAQNSGAYAREMQHGETGLLFDTPEQFEEQLSLLIENTTERQRLARNAKDWVHENRDAMKEVPKIVQFWEELRAERRLEQPHVSDAQWDEIEAQSRQEMEAAGGTVPGQ